MKYITFLGASGTVTGSSYFLHDANMKGILIDLGMFQGNNEIERWNYDAIPFHPTDLDGVFLTHAHLDHSGRLPLLRKFGYRGPIYMTEATRMLVELTLRDSAKISAEHGNGMALYTEQDVEWILTKAVYVAYDETVTVGPYAVTFRNAGHILGSAFLEVHCADHEDGIRKITFSGDLGNYPDDLVQPTQTVDESDVVLIESTYGDRKHNDENARQILQEEINGIEESGGTLLIPAFSVERTQEILHHIDHLKKNSLVQLETAVYLDSPLGIKVTHIYQQYRNLYNKELTEHTYTDDPFDFPGLAMIEHGRESQKIIDKPGPKVVIAGSGMMNGGRIINHAQMGLSNEQNRILFVGFQGEGTLGRYILDGNPDVMIKGFRVPIRCHVRKSSSMSSHADQPKLLQWLSTIQGLAHLCLVHGENPQRKALGEKVKEVLPSAPTIYLPTRYQTFTFGPADKKVVLFGSSSPKTTVKQTYIPRFTILSA